MILERVRPYGFRSVQAPLENFWVKENLSILIGSNEHGKSNLLQAIAYINKDQYLPGDKCRSTKVQGKDLRIPQIDFFFKLDEREKASLIERLTRIQGLIPAEKDEKTIELESRINIILLDLQNNLSPKIKVHLIPGSRRRIFYLLPNGGEKFLDYDHPLNADAATFFDSIIPKVVEFGPDDDLPGTISLAELNTGASKAFEGLLRLDSKIWDQKELLFANSLEGRQFRETATKKIQAKLRLLWTQGRKDEADLRIDIELDTASNRLILDFSDISGTRDEPKQRSLGFRSFFSFYLKLFAQTREMDPHGYILSFDEPGIHLHPSGQKDLLRELKKIAGDNQVIFATHSPFMIDRNPSTGVIVVTKDKTGTHLDQKPYRKNWAPVRTSLGIVMNDSFFYADKTLLVEGTSDRIYIFSLLSKLADELGININLLSIVDGDNGKETPALARILLSEDRKMVLLVDKDEGGESIAKRIRLIAKDINKEAGLEISNVGEHLSRDGDLSSEDLVPSDLLEVAIQKYLNEVLKIATKFSLSDLPDNKKSLGKKLVEYFNEKKWTDENSNFSKTTVADFVSQAIIDPEYKIPADHPSRSFCRWLSDAMVLK